MTQVGIEQLGGKKATKNENEGGNSMTRTPGSKNNPPDLHQELEKVRKLFADKGADFLGDQPKQVDDSGKEGLQIQTGDESGDDDGFECGACGSDLPSQLDTCPHCGAKLTWSA